MKTSFSDIASSISLRRQLPAELKNGSVVFPCVGLSVSCQQILDLCQPKKNDVIFVCGSLVEGFGNTCSDIDVYVVTDERPKASIPAIEQNHRVLSLHHEIIRNASSDEVLLLHSVVPDTSVKIDVQIVLRKELQELYAKAHSLFDYAVKNLALFSKSMSYRDKKLIHRLLNSIPIHSDSSAPVSNAISREKFCYLAYRWVASDFSRILDIVGACQSDQWMVALDRSRENLIRQAMATMHLNGLTDAAGKKWLPIYSNNKGLFPEQLASKLRGLLLYSSLKPAPHKRNALDYVLQCLEFCDQLFQEWQTNFSWMAVPEGENALSLLSLDHQFSHHNTKYAELEYDYRAKAYGGGKIPLVEYLDHAPNLFQK